MTTLDPVADARTLADSLASRGRVEDAARLSDAIESGSTGSEILMALRYLVDRLGESCDLDPEERSLAERIVAGVDASGV